MCSHEEFPKQTFQISPVNRYSKGSLSRTQSSCILSLKRRKLMVRQIDTRWGNYVPWLFRYEHVSTAGNFSTLFSRLSQRLERLFKFNECDVNLAHFGPWLESETLQLFQHDSRGTLDTAISAYFSPAALESAAMADTLKDKDEQEADVAEKTANRLKWMLNPPPRGIGNLSGSEWTMEDPKRAKRDLVKREAQAKDLRSIAEATREQRKLQHYLARVKERISVLESLLQLLPQDADWYSSLVRDIRRFFAESAISLDVKIEDGFPARIVPIDEPLLQREVTESLLPRLFQVAPERAHELIGAYHDVLIGKPRDSIFIEAFKSLEQLARDLTSDKEFVFNAKCLNKHFPALHGSIRETLIRLDGYRGDKGGHGKSAPPIHEIRYLLFAICNAALLLLDYPLNS
jgi:hypothetical protein